MRTLVAVVLSALIVATAWLVLFRSDAPVMPSANVAETPTVAPTAAPVVGDVATPAAVTAPPATVVAKEADAAKRTEATPQFTGPVGELQVVHQATKEPVADANVAFIPPDFDWQKMSAELRELASKDNEAFQARISRTVTTDAAGRCRVPLGEHGVGVVATKDDLWGQAHVKPGATEPTVLALRPDRTLHVLVQDVAGKPVHGIEVMLRPMEFAIGATDAAGRIAMRHIQQHVRDAAVPTVTLAAAFPGGETAPVEIDATAPPPEVVLRLPAGGSVTVSLRDGEGKPLDPTYLGNPTVRLAAWAEKPSEDEERHGFNRARGNVPIDEHGVAVFETVGFGAFVKAYADWLRQTAVVTGPTVANPRVDLVIAESADDTVLHGTLLAVDSKPLASSEFQVVCRSSRGMGSQRGRTDGSGRFRVAVGSQRSGAVSLAFDNATTLGTSVEPFAVELPPRELKAGRNDLGEVVLLPHVVLVQGKVTGDAVPQRHVQLQIEREIDKRWQQEWNLQPEWLSDGTFTLRSGIAKGTPIRLVVQATGLLPVAPIECKAGDTGIEISLQKGGSAVATFLVDANVPLDRMMFRFRRTDPPPQKDQRADWMERMNMFRDPGEAKGGRLQREWPGLQPGRYRLQVLCAGTVEPIVAIDAVAVADGPTTDPRLVDIDLRGRVRTLEIRATAADGKPIAAADAFIVIRSSGEEWSGFHLGGGSVRVAAAAAVDLIVLAKGHKAAFVDAVTDSRTFALEAAAEARLVCQFASPLPDGAQLQLSLKPGLELSRRARIQLDNGSGMMLENFFEENAVVDGDGRCVLPVRFPGSYTIEGRVTIGAHRGGVFVRGFEPNKITLPAVGDVVVRVGQKELDRALESSRR